MQPQTPRGREGLHALLSEPRHAVVALDYDGTLAPIVDRPEDAMPHPSAVETLQELARRVGRVAIITGRPAEVIAYAFGAVPGLVVLGQYGVQRWQEGELREEPPLPGLERARKQVPFLLEDEVGVTVEDKGLSLVVHARQALEPMRALSRLHPGMVALAARNGLELHSGRMVLELRPPGHDKGRALRSLVEGSSAILYAGDDVGDLLAYDEVDRQREQGIGGLLVCSDSDEAPDELRTRADVVVPGPDGVVLLLADLTAELA